MSLGAPGIPGPCPGRGEGEALLSQAAASCVGLLSKIFSEEHRFDEGEQTPPYYFREGLGCDAQPLLSL